MNKKIKWVLQKNLTNQDTLNNLKEAILNNNAEYEEITIIPFFDEIEYENKNNENLVFYGSTTLILNAYKKDSLKKGIFYDIDAFNMFNYIQKWENNMLNADGITIKPLELLNTTEYDNHEYFCRPNEDTKLFTGGICNIKEFKKDLQLILDSNPHVNENTTFFLSSPKKIEKEWRNFIVNKKVVSSSRYILNEQLSISTDDIPDEMIKFVEDACKQYTPHDIFVMDIALSNNEYKIIECNCFNGTGFYNHNINSIVKEINKHLSL